MRLRPGYDDLLFARTPQIPKRKRRVVSDPILVGWDTEFTAIPTVLGGPDAQAVPSPPDRRLLSNQFAIRDDSGSLQSTWLRATDVKMTVAEWLEELLRFVSTHRALVPDKKGRVTLYVAAHHAAAELGGLRDVLEHEIHQYGKAHRAKFERRLKLDGEEITLRVNVVDTFGHLAMSLKKIGKMVGLPKIEIGDWIERMDQLLGEDPELFGQYARRDAEIEIRVIEDLRVFFDPWGVDPLLLPTMASMSGAAFRGAFMSRAPVQSKEVVVKTHWDRDKKTGLGKKIEEKAKVFAGNPSVRRLAYQCYWGGRIEAYGRGRYVGTLLEYDAQSLYPHAAKLQPLPHAETKWREIRDVTECLTLEGVARVRYEFTPDELYPCLPTLWEQEDGSSRLVFPRHGESFCTFAEIREALKIGARIWLFEAYGFRPGPTEIDHDVGRYVDHFMGVKNAAQKGDARYTLAKNAANSLIGKFGEKPRDSLHLSIEREARIYGRAGLVAQLARMPELRGMLRRGVLSPGSLFVPEWSSLILGRSRAVMASIIRSGRALLVKTDSVLIRAEDEQSMLGSDGVKALLSVGSQMCLEGTYDGCLIDRAVSYALLKRPGNVTADERANKKVLGEDETWAVLKVSRGSSPEDANQFAATILSSLQRGKDCSAPVEKIRLLTARGAVLLGEQFYPGDPVASRKQTRFKWDQKRRLVRNDANEWRRWTDSSPYLEVATLDQAARRKIQEREGARYRDARNHQVRFERAVRALGEGMSYRKVADMVKLSKSTVARLAKAIRLEQPEPARESDAAEIGSVANPVMVDDLMEAAAVETVPRASISFRAISAEFADLAENEIASRRTREREANDRNHEKMSDSTCPTTILIEERAPKDSLPDTDDQNGCAERSHRIRPTDD